MFRVVAPTPVVFRVRLLETDPLCTVTASIVLVAPDALVKVTVDVSIPSTLITRTSVADAIAALLKFSVVVLPTCATNGLSLVLLPVLVLISIVGMDARLFRVNVLPAVELMLVIPVTPVAAAMFSVTTPAVVLVRLNCSIVVLLTVAVIAVKFAVKVS